MALASSGDVSPYGGISGVLSPAPKRVGLSELATSFLFVPLLGLYGFTVQFGSLFRFGSEETSRGVSTLLFAAIILLGVVRGAKAFLQEPLLWLLGGLIVYLVLPSLLILGESTRPLLTLIDLAGYIAMGAVLARTRLRERHSMFIWACIAGGLLLSSLATIVDFAGIVNIPYNNETLIVTKLEGLNVEQATGFFIRRSSMAAIFSLGITGAAVICLGRRGFAARIFFGAAAVLGLVCLFLTHNRSGVLGSIAIVALYVLRAPRFRGLSRAGIVMLSGVLGVLLIGAVQLLYPEHTMIYLEKLGFLGLADSTWASDHTRVDLFWTAIRALVTNPLGHGLTLIRLPGGLYYNAHNLFTHIIWASGIFSLVWLPMFFGTLYLHMRRGRWLDRQLGADPLQREALGYALLAWFLGGMTHVFVSTGLAWMMFGALLSNQHEMSMERKRANLALGETWDPSRGRSQPES